MQVYDEHFSNKRIAVVGNALSLFDKEYGKLIDSYDIVCRFNLGISVDSPHTHGTKTDWCIFNNADFAVKNNLFDILPNIRYLQVYYKENIVEELPELPITTVSNKIITDLNNKTNNNYISTGSVFLYILSKITPLEVGIFGYDFKQTYTWYNKNYKQAKQRKNEKHDWSFEKQFMLNTLDKNTNFKWIQ